MNKNQEKNSKNPVAAEEEKVLEFWEKSKTFEKSVAKDAPEGEYVFYDGPPFITGMPHYATLLPSIAKDMIPRYQTMKGKRVRRVWGWDCHGLPAENKVEQELGLKNKNDIEELGVGKFVDACRTYVDSGSEQWKWYIDRIARWVDMENSYKTMDLPFMESVIWAFKQLYDKGLIYEGYRSSLHCPRCATPLSKFEITMDAGSYKDVQDESVIVKFKLLNHESRIKNQEGDVYILAWTTTPWTLPGNLALAVGENIEYVIARTKKDLGELGEGELNVTPGTYIFAKDRFEEIVQEGSYFEDGFETVLGKDLLELSYEPLFALGSEVVKNNKAAYKIYAGDFVSTEEGTGVVHIAPNFGEDDFELGKSKNLPMIDLMNEMGHYSDEAGDFAGLFFKKAGHKVMEELGDQLFFREMHSHSYPFCYRCDSRLIFKSQKAWYLRISEIREKMLETNQDINWVPDFFKEGRFKYNLENAPDWCLSRSRYWGSPIPVWRCQSCGEIEVLGSLDEIEKRSGLRVEDLHRPGIDEVEFACPECGDKMKRVKEVLDCWFESGSMPFAQFHFPFNQVDDVDFEKPQFPFPSDFIIEYTGQLRGWFYYLHVISNALFGREAFQNVIVSGVLAGTDGRKMSKSYGNYPDPKLTLDKYGADALRIYFMQSSIMAGDDTSLCERDIQDALRKNIMLLWNVTRFYKTFSEQENIEVAEIIPESENDLDKYIITRLEQLLIEVTSGLEEYDLPKASRPITQFIDDLSTVYIRKSRSRVKSSDSKDKEAALKTMAYVLLKFSKILAPISPFIAERVWQSVTINNFENANESVHLEKWPEKNEKFVKDNLEIVHRFEIIKQIETVGNYLRDEAKMKVRQPLALLQYELLAKREGLSSANEQLVADELNVKQVESQKIEVESGGDVIEKDGVYYVESGGVRVSLDTNLSDDLRLEGMKREIVRTFNAARKKEKLTISDKINVFVEASETLEKVFEKFGEDIKQETVAVHIDIEKVEDGQEVDVNGEKMVFRIAKI